MKKIVSMILVLAVVMALCTAFASEINWSDIEGQITEAGWEGEFKTYDQIAIKMWVPTALQEVELTEDFTEAGYIGYYMTADGTCAVALQYIDFNGMSLEEYSETIAEYGAEKIEACLLNGFDCVTYELPENDTNAVAFTTQAGYVLEMSFSPASDEGFAAVAAVMAASIQAE